MRMRDAIIQKVYEKKIIAIVRGVYDEDCLQLARALYEGGVEMMEVTFDQSKPEELNHTTETVRRCIEDMGDKMIFGAGTVTTVDMVKLAKEAGAQFIVSPDVNEAVIKATRELNLVSMPGAMTATEVLKAHSYGADFVKLFPIANLGPAYVKALRGPINHIPLLAVGGVSEKNIREFMDAGVVGAGVGGNLVNKKWIASGEFEKITEVARQLMENAQ